jgi:hypothetical protein
MLTDIKLGDQERNRQVKNLANINRYTVDITRKGTGPANGGTQAQSSLILTSSLYLNYMVLEKLGQ